MAQCWVVVVRPKGNVAHAGHCAWMECSRCPLGEWPLWAGKVCQCPWILVVLHCARAVPFLPALQLLQVSPRSTRTSHYFLCFSLSHTWHSPMVRVCLTPLDHSTDDLANPLLWLLLSSGLLVQLVKFRAVWHRELWRRMRSPAVTLHVAKQNSGLEHALHSGVNTGKNCSW